MFIQLRKSAKNSARPALLFLALLFGAFLGIDDSTAGSQRAMVVHVNSVPSVVGESGLRERMIIELGRGNAYQIVQIDEENSSPAFPENANDLEALRNWGAEVGGRYLMMVDVYRQAIEQKKTFNIPLILHKYQAVGIIEGEVRLLDISRGKMLLSEPFRVETKGPRIIQAYFDDNRHDADISIPATHKSAFFREMETDAAKQIRKLLRTVTNGK
ncbi:MAG: hypothetical protein P1R58_07905 [bacterium]|nr:hypothetical protein [bacterium]